MSLSARLASRATWRLTQTTHQSSSASRALLLGLREVVLAALTISSSLSPLLKLTPRFLR